MNSRPEEAAALSEVRLMNRLAKAKWRFPHPLVLLAGGIVVAAALSYVLPAGQYDRRKDAATGREVVIPASYHHVDAHPVGGFEALVAIPKGMGDAREIIFFIFLIGGAFSVVDKTGALRQGVSWLAGRLQRQESLVIPVSCVMFAGGGTLDGMWEEIIALIPVLLVLTRRLGYSPLTAVAMSLGAAGVGGAFSPINPFNVGIGQKLSEIPILSGALFRTAVLIPALGIWTWGTIRHATRTRVAVDAATLAKSGSLDARHLMTLGVVIGTFAALIVGVIRYQWGFDQMSGLFAFMGVTAGLVGGLGVRGTAEAYVLGFQSMAYAALLVGFARAIYFVLDQGRIVDTIIHALVTPLTQCPGSLYALGMLTVQAMVAVPVPSCSGQAVLTLPILVPLSDLLGVSRQVTVLAYQYGAGLCGQLTPTGGALLAILAVAGVSYEEWLKFAAPLCIVLYVLCVAALGLAIVIGLT